MQSVPGKNLKHMSKDTKIQTKDPAFLFYSKDFYEGTRMMTPDERGCYIDLLIFQHQNGYIPDDIRRLSLYCSGCSPEIITEVLSQKFVKKQIKMADQMVSVWFNKRLENEQNLRSNSKPKKVASATFAGLISSAKLSKAQINTLKNAFKIDAFIYDNNHNINDLDQIKKNIYEWFKQTVNQTVNHALANANANANVIKKEKGVKGEKQFQPPTVSEVIEFFKSNGYSEAAAKKAFEHYNLADWHDTNGKKVLNWKQKINTIWFKPENKANGKEIESTRYSRNPVSV